jgi:histidine triad (HIT) family protein
MEECIFCSIANGNGSNLIWQDDAAAAFRDIHPKAPVHILVVPKKHIQHLDDLDDVELGGRLLIAAKTVAREMGIQDAYRVHINNGHAAGQVVDHLHIHVLGKLSDSVLDDLRHEGL